MTLVLGFSKVVKGLATDRQTGRNKDKHTTFPTNREIKTADRGRQLDSQLDRQIAERQTETNRKTERQTDREGDSRESDRPQGWGCELSLQQTSGEQLPCPALLPSVPKGREGISPAERWSTPFSRSSLTPPWGRPASLGFPLLKTD